MQYKTDKREKLKLSIKKNCNGKNNDYCGRVHVPRFLDEHTEMNPSLILLLLYFELGSEVEVMKWA